MLKKLVATGVVFGAGYILGVTFGFRAAVVDYVESDAEKLESMAESIYPSPKDGASGENFPNIVEKRESGADDGSKGFQ